jgi:hypothetical protein
MMRWNCSPDGGAQRRNPGPVVPDFASLHPGYSWSVQ